MRKYISTIAIFLIFLVGLLIMFYPNISNWYNNKMSSYVVSNYTAILEDTDDEKYEEMLKEARAYNEELHSLPKQFISGEAEDETYIETLDVYNGMMGYIVIEKLDIKLPILHGTDEDVLQTSVGHLEGSSLPTGDVGNNTVLTGHTGLPSAELFTGLTELELGDAFELYILNEVFTYEIFNIIVVEPYEVDNLEAVDGKDIVTLVTCTPYGVNSHRLLVQGEQIDVEIDETSRVVMSDVDLGRDYMEYVLIAASIIITILIILIIENNIRTRNDKKNKKGG